MRGRLWLSSFIAAVESTYKEHPPDEDCQDSEWTQFMGMVMDEIGKKANCYVIRKKPDESESGEYFNIDAVFVENAEYPPNWRVGEYDPFVLPAAAAELENQYDRRKISYCLWKLLCVRAPIRALICYQRSNENVEGLKKQLEKVVWEGSLMKGSDGDLLVIVGNDGIEEKKWSSLGRFRSFFRAFEWRHDSLEEVEWPSLGAE